MNTFEAIKERRSVKHYDPNYKMSDEQIKQLISLAALSPTSFNMQNWRFVVITDQEKRQQLREAAWNQAQVTEASIVVMLCANLNAHADHPERYWSNAPEEVRQTLVPMLTGFYNDNPSLQRDEALRSCGIAGQTLMLAAKEMGLDSCPMIGFDIEKVAQIINLPQDHCIGFMITIGRAAQPAQPRGGQLPIEDILIENSF